MFYLLWIVTAFIAVGAGCYLAGRFDKNKN